MTFFFHFPIVHVYIKFYIVKDKVYKIFGVLFSITNDGALGSTTIFKIYEKSFFFRAYAFYEESVLRHYAQDI